MPKSLNESISLNTDAVANVALMLTTHLIAILLREDRIEPVEVQELFQTVRARYTNTPGARPSDEWEAQTLAILTLVQNDVAQFGQRPA
jgi:hypothetical protein